MKDCHLSTVIYTIMKNQDFYKKILNQKLSVGFKQPELPKYDFATRDLNDHIYGFDKQLNQYDDALLKCKLFPTTLNNKAEIWFSKLLSNCIVLWSNFCYIFIQEFRYNYFKTKKVDYQFSIKVTRCLIRREVCKMILLESYKGRRL